MRSRRKKSAGPSGELLFSEHHLTDEALLLLLDGELTPRQAEVVSVHVRSCWSCRARKDAIGCSVADVVDYQTATTAAYLPPSLQGRGIFRARLSALAMEIGEPSLFRPWASGLSRFWKSCLVDRRVWTAATLVLGIVIPASYLLRKPAAAVSANELLGRSVASDLNSLKAVPQPAVIQKLRIRAGARVFTRTTYRDVMRKRFLSRTEGSSRDELEVKTLFLKSSFDWNEPLAPEEYSRWRISLSTKQDSIERVGNDLLKLETKTPTGPVAEASLTVRSSDYHAVEENLRLRDDSTIEVAELSYNVVASSSLAPDLFGLAAQPPAVGFPAISSPLPVHIATSEAELAKIELEAQAALHGVGADLGEQIDVRAMADGVLIEGVIADEARKQQLVSALESIPHTKIRLLTLADAAAQQQPVVSSSAPLQLTANAPPLLESRLKAGFPDEDQRIVYVNQTLALAQMASARAWALNRLADHYPAQKAALLDSSAREQLHILLTDHISALREDASRLDNQLGQVLSTSSNTAAANTTTPASPAPASPRVQDQAGDWREHIHRVHSSVETIHESVVALLTGSPTNDRDDEEAVEVGLRTALTQLQAELQVLDQQVHRIILTSGGTEQ